MLITNFVHYTLATTRSALLKFSMKHINVLAYNLPELTGIYLMQVVYKLLEGNNACVVVHYAGQWRGNPISTVNSSHNGTNTPKWVSVFPMLYDMTVYLPE